MRQKFIFEELDEESQQYLWAVKNTRGASMPGVFLARKNNLPWVSFFVGLAVLGFTLWWTWRSLGEPIKTAMFQTAGFLLGGWLVVAAFRVWAADKNPRYLGHFVYADPLYLWEAAGTTVKVIGLNNLTSAQGIDNYNEGAYQNTSITLHLNPGKYHFTLNNQLTAQQFLVYLNCLAVMRQGVSPAWLPPEELSENIQAENPDYPVAPEVPGEPNTKNLKPEDMGYMARQSAGLLTELMPEQAESIVIPTQPHRFGRARSGIVNYLVIAALAIGGTFLLEPVNVILRDDAIFDLVKNQGPPELRAYLIDERNTRHRQAVENRLASFYEPAIQRIEKEAGDKELGAQFMKKVNHLKTAIQPLVSIRVKEKTNIVAGGGRAAVKEREDKVFHLLREKMTKALENPPTPGDKLVDFVEVNEEIPSMIEVHYEFAASGKVFNLDWTIQLRHNPEDQPVSKTWKRKDLQDLALAVEEEARTSVFCMTGYKDPPPVPVVNPLPLNPPLKWQIPPILPGKPKNTFTGQLDAVNKSRFFKITMLQGKTYQIDMLSFNPMGLDPYLRLLDAKGIVLAEDDDGGVNRNARIIFQAKTAGIYQIEATSFDAVIKGQPGQGVFSVEVRER